MLKSLNIKSLNIIFIIKIFCLLFIASAKAQNLAGIGKEIEKSLLFDQQSKEQFDIYSSEAPINKDTAKSITIGEKEKPQPKGKKDKDKKPDLDIAVTEKSKIDYKMREKEKFAYNAVLAGQYEIAIELYKSVLEKEPKNAYAKYALATVYQKLGQYRQSKNLYQDLLKDDPENKQEIINNIISIMIEESPREASYLLARLSQQNPDSAFIASNAAIVNDKLGNIDKAIEYCQKTIQIEPENASYQYNLAILYDRSKQYNKAIEHYTLVIKNHSEQYKQISLSEVQNRIANLKSIL
jgi:tetratricopeptide (TPR) repeat protein